MHLLISFCNTRAPELPALGLLDVATSEFEVLKLPGDSPPLFGITGLGMFGDFIYAIAQGAANNLAKSSSCLLVFDRANLRIRNLYYFRSAVDVHSICATNEVLYVVSTGTDEVVELRLRGSSVLSEAVVWRPVPDGPREDTHHFNSIVHMGEGNLLVAGFGSKDGPLWSSAKNGFIFNITRQQKIADGLEQPHSLAHLDAEIGFCESRKKAVRKLGGPGNQCLPGYTRGLCQVGRHLFVGTSMGREVSRSTGNINNPADPGPSAGKCAVVRLSVDTLVVEEIIELGEAAREIYDLLPIEGTATWQRVPGIAWRSAALRGLVAALDRQTSRTKQSAEALHGVESQLRAEQERCAAVTAEHSVNATELATKIEVLGWEADGLRQELAGRDKMIERLEGVSKELQESFRHEVQKQIDQLRDELAQREARILANLDGLQRPIARQQSPAVSLGSPSGGLGAKKGIDRQQYREMIERVRRLVASAVPANATIAVVTKGDPELLQLEGRRGWHFPQLYDGTYSGFYPKDSGAALEELNRIRANGAEYLLFPATALWWLEYYKDFAAHLGANYRLVSRDEDTGVIFALQESSVGKPSPSPAKAQECGQLVRQMRGLIDSILPPDAKVVVVSNGDPGLLNLGRRVALPFPQDANGANAGSYPSDSRAAITHLEEQRQTGAHFLVVPKTAASWFDHYLDFARYLEANYRAVVRQRHVCTIFDLNGR